MAQSKYLDRRTLVYFSPAQLALNEEVVKHPKLMERLGNKITADFEVKLAEVASYCGILLDGYYDKNDIDTICDLCITELKKRSSAIILPFG